MAGSKHAAVIAGILGLSSLALAFSSGPPDGRTGAPTEQTCAISLCHSSFPLNSGNGSVTITAPVSYIQGDTIDIQVKVTQMGQIRWGFELTVLDMADQPVGELLVTDTNRTQKTTALNSREYVKHRVTGTDAGVPNSSPGWSFRWVANNGVSGPVMFYAAGNAANNNGFNSGDFIYTTSNVVTEDTGGPGCCVGMTGNVDGDPGEIVDIGDLTTLISFLFIPPNNPPACMEEANIDGDSGGVIDIGDLTALISFLFIPPNIPPTGCQ